MENQKVINLLDYSSNEQFKFTAKEWYAIDSQTKKDQHIENDSIKFEIETINLGLF